MDQAMRDEPIGKLLLRMSPPVMLALLIQSIYNIVDSYFVGKYYSLKGHLNLKECLHIYKAGAPSMVMQSLYTFYIVGLNLILKLFTEDAVTVLGIYYKLQTFFFIPLMGLEQVILPIVSFNYGAGEIRRAKLVLKYTTIFSCGVMLAATAVFWAVPAKLLGIFSESESIIQIGCYALRVIGSSFLPLGITLIFTVYLQGMNLGRESMMLIILRQVILFVPLAWIFHYHGLKAVWMTFPVTEVIVAAACIWVYMKEERKSNKR